MFGLSCVWGGEKGKWEVKFIPNLKISKNCVSCLVFFPSVFCNQDRKGGCSRKKKICYRKLFFSLSIKEAQEQSPTCGFSFQSRKL